MMDSLKSHAQKLRFDLPPADYDHDQKLEFKEWYLLVDPLKEDKALKQYYYQGDVKDGKIEGRGIRITPHGNVRLCYKKNGREHGPYTTFENDGTLVKGSYKNGVPCGEWTTYSPDGKVES